jgi:uncharacterized protein DUF4232
MADLENRLRETLQRRAVAVPPQREVPAGLIQRAWARIVRNVSAVAFAVAVVAIGAVTGVHALSGQPQDRPATSPQPAPACLAIDLRGASKLEASYPDPATREGYLTVTNAGKTACSLQGRPVVRVVNPNGFGLSLRGGSVDPFWATRGLAPPPDWPVVTLQPGDKAKIHVQWTSWCKGTRDTDPTKWQIQFAASRGTVEFPVTDQDVPICASQGQDPTLRVGPFEPYST